MLALAILPLMAADAWVLPSARNEIAVAGEIRVRVKSSEIVEAFRHIETLKRCAEVPAVGRFGVTPQLADLSQVPEPDRARMLDAARRYRREGRANAAFEGLAGRSERLVEVAPELQRFLTAYPSQPLDTEEDFLYWSRERLGPKTISTITHAVVYRPRQPGITLIATKQVYASGFVDASLGLTVIEDDGAGARVTYINRTVAGILGGWLRPFIAGHTLSTMRRKLDDLRDRLERQPVAVSVR